MKRFATLLLGLGLITSSVGCYCSPYGYGGYGAGGGCGPGGCAPGGYQPGGYQPGAYQPGAYYNSSNTIQAAVPMQMAPMTAMGPIDALPTY